MPSLLSHFASFEGYPTAFPRLNTGVSNQTLRPIAPTPLQVHQQNYYSTSDPSSLPQGGPITPALTHDTFLADPSPIPLSADSSGTFPSSSQYLFGEGSRGLQHGSLQRHASISGCHPGYQPWLGALNSEQVQNRPTLARSNTLTSFNPFTSPLISQPSGDVFSPMALPCQPSAPPFSSSTEDQAPLTSTQIAAFGGQPLPPDHPFYSEVKEHYSDPNLDIASRGMWIYGNLELKAF
jgi:hypothetical protein